MAKNFETCKKCGELLAVAEGYQENDGAWLCCQCYEDEIITCPECDGTGSFLFIFPRACPVCMGEGKGKRLELRKNSVDFYAMLIRNQETIF